MGCSFVILKVATDILSTEDWNQQTPLHYYFFLFKTLNRKNQFAALQLNKALSKFLMKTQNWYVTSVYFLDMKSWGFEYLLRKWLNIPKKKTLHALVDKFRERIPNQWRHVVFFREYLKKLLFWYFLEII